MSATLSPSTPTNRRISGITKASVNGVAMQIVDGTWFTGAVKREDVNSLSGTDGYSETPVAPFMAGKFRDLNTLNASGFNALTGATVIFELANGKTITGHNLWNTGETTVTIGDSTFDFRFAGVQGSVVEKGGA